MKIRLKWKRSHPISLIPRYAVDLGNLQDVCSSFNAYRARYEGQKDLFVQLETYCGGL